MRRITRPFRPHGSLFAGFMLLVCFVLAGCGVGGYIGGGIQSLSRATAIIDAGQTIGVSADVSAGLPIAWTLTGAACATPGACGSLSATTGNTIVYTAPQGVVATFQVVLTAAVQGTSNSKITTITVNPAPQINGDPPSAVLGTPYSTMLTASGGTPPLRLTLSGGTLPPGLQFAAATGVISGTPTATGTFVSTFSLTDSSDVPLTVTAQETITVVTQTSAALVITGNPPAGTVGVAYSSQLGVTGGVGPYTWSVASGALPAGLSLVAATGRITGTPTTQGTFSFTVNVQDANGTRASANFTITIVAAGSTLTLSSSPLPSGTMGIPYSATIGVSGGTAPYTCVQTGGTLPAGLSLAANCNVTGTPTTAGTSTLTVRVTDSANPANAITGPVSITINPAPVLISIGNPPVGTIGVPYTGTIPVTGGTAPYTCALVSGTLPAGLTLNANCTLTGTPTAPGTTTVTVRATDSGNPPSSSTGTVTITINPAPTLTITDPPPATAGAPYTGSVGVSGGTPPYHCALSGGTMPAGLTLQNNCGITGTPIQGGTTTVTVTVTDSNNPPITKTGPVTIVVNPPATLTLTGTLPNAVLNQPYTQTLQAAGGVGPYTYTLTAGSLPPGITLSTGGVISGTPTAVGATSFTVKATDSEATPQTASLALTLLVVYAPTANDSLLNGPYAYLFQGYDDVVAGVLAYQTATVGSFTASGTGVISAGEFDSNHQGSTATGNTVATRRLLGTYTIGADYRGTLALTAVNTDGTTGGTTIYAIAVKPAVPPATTSSSGTMIEFDNNLLAGTRGSGSFLAQTATDFATGVQGSFVFGMSGDTPCLPACSIGILAGPVASVGQFTVSGGVISGTGDANISTTKIANSTLSGSVGAADSSGRVQLTMNASGTLNGVYPGDYAVYMVSAGQAFVMSTDKHSAYILLAGSAQKQTQATFNNGSLNNAFVGYENAPTNPGLAGVALQNVLNLSTVTVFRGTADGGGNCTTTNVDTGGTTGLVNGLTGLGSGSAILNALLGTYQSLGNSTCGVSANGRAVFNYPPPSTLLTGTLTLLGLGNNPPDPRVVYLYAPNKGFFLETGYAGLGRIELQTGAPFTVGTLNGTFTYGTAPAASLASLNASGIFTADGAGHATYIYDENLGVGNVNALQLGVSGSGNYVLTDPLAGRFLLGSSTVIYAIAPGRFVTLDTSALSTSPSIALLQ